MEKPSAKTILVIDDEPDIRAFLMAVIEDSGYFARSMEEDERLESVVTQCRPDLILLDIMMPNRSGMAMYKALRSMTGFQNVPIILISGLDVNSGFSDSILNEAHLAPPDGLMEKPLNIPALMQMVATILDR